MKDKEKLALLLKVFKAGHIDFDSAIDIIFRIYSGSKRFNWNNFQLGMFVGQILMYVIMKYIVKI